MNHHRRFAGPTSPRTLRLAAAAGVIVTFAIAAVAARASGPLRLAVAQSPDSGAPAARNAPRAGCIELTTVAQLEKETVDEQGRKVTELVPATRVVPGTEVVWVVTAKNVCQQPAGNIAIDNPVPQHMQYVANSAVGIGSSVSFSLDGRRFEPASSLTVRDPDGATRAARPEEYTHIRWTFANPISPGQLAIAQYRAVLK